MICDWCKLEIRYAIQATNLEGLHKRYHRDCYEYGLNLDPEGVGWTPTNTTNA